MSESEETREYEPARCKTPDEETCTLQIAERTEIGLTAESRLLG